MINTPIKLLLLWTCMLVAARAEAFYTLQLQVDPSREAQLQGLLQLRLMHRENFGGQENFIYLGEFNSAEAAQIQLDLLNKKSEDQLKHFNPVVMELFTPRSQQIKPQLKTQAQTKPTPAEQTPTPKIPSKKNPPADTLLTKNTSPGKKTVPSKKITPEETVAPLMHPQPTRAQSTAPQSMPTESIATKNNTHDAKGPIYTVALAAFKREKNRQKFIDSQPHVQFYCRTKNNGLFASYTGIFYSYKAAIPARDKAMKIKGISPYIVKFNNSTLREC